MPDANKAVFLSYAHEDADVARRIAEALRGEGIEVWFDESALGGGEAWDARSARGFRLRRAYGGHVGFGVSSFELNSQQEAVR